MTQRTASHRAVALKHSSSLTDNLLCINCRWRLQFQHFYVFNLPHHGTTITECSAGSEDRMNDEEHKMQEMKEQTSVLTILATTPSNHRFWPKYFLSTSTDRRVVGITDEPGESRLSVNKGGRRGT